MAQKIYSKILVLIKKAQNLARSAGIFNILQPGLIKEMIIADILGHTLITSKNDSDAHNPNNAKEKYEYLSCKEGGSGQLDRMFKEPQEKRQKSLNRILRNKKIYYAVFYKTNQIKVKIIYEINPKLLAKESKRQLDKSRNKISHVGFSEKWVKKNGIVVYTDRT